MNTLKPLAFAALLALAPAFAFAQTPPAAPGKAAARMKAADKDGDGMLSRAEVDAAGLKGLSKNFDAIDTNKDGKLSRDEIKAYRQARKAARKGGGTIAPATQAPPASPGAPGK